MHRIIAEEFIGPISDKYVVDHKDRNRTNNQFTNLRIVTESENAQNRSPRGSSNYHQYRSEKSKE